MDKEWLSTEQALAQSRQQQEQANLALEARESEYQRAHTELIQQEPDLIMQKGRLVQAQEWEEELKAIRVEWTD
ncbi:hypothetical protein SB767_35460, partial [Bacillus sp. SIMBA_069]